MQLIIVSGKVIATHADEQDVTGCYPGAEIVPSVETVAVGDPDPRPAMGAEATMATIRKKRDQLLRESDWTQVLDCPLSLAKQNEWKQYRKSLRDLPGTVGNKKPHEIVWPRKPK